MPTVAVPSKPSTLSRVERRKHADVLTSTTQPRGGFFFLGATMVMAYAPPGPSPAPFLRLRDVTLTGHIAAPRACPTLALCWTG